MHPKEEQIWNMIEPGVKDLGLRLVRVRLSGGEENTNLQIMIEPTEATLTNPVSVTLAECEAVSRMTSALMDVEDPIENKYHLEVSSTGMERPLVMKDDFQMYAGANVKLETLDLVDGRRRFKGVLNGIEGDMIQFTLEEGDDVSIPHSQLKKAKVVYSEEEIRAFMNNKASAS